MAGFTFARNTAFNWHGRPYRIEQINPDESFVLHCLEDGSVSSAEKNRLLEAYVKSELEFSTSHKDEDANTYCRPFEEIDEIKITEMRRRMAYINGVRELEYGDKTVGKTEQIIETVSISNEDDHPPCYTTLTRWQKRNQLAGGDVRSLVPRTDKRGPRCRYQPERVTELFEESFIDALKKSPKATVKDVRTLLLKKLKAENEFRPKDQQLRLPSRATCYRMLDDIDRFEVAVLRDGKRLASRKYKLVGKGVQTKRILERYEIDHTPMDVFVVDEKTFLPLGRPLLTIILDHNSRMPVGYYISFSAPSAAVVQAALKHAILPKTLTKVPGLQTQNEWICWGIPEQIVVDNGLEFHGSAMEYLAFNLYIQLMFCPKHEPQFKGAVERYIKTINYQCAHLLPGMAFAKYYERKDYDPLKHAVFTLNELKAIVEKWMLDDYAQSIHSGLGVSPYSKWKKGLETVTPNLPKDIDQLSPVFGIPIIRSLRKDGILVNRIRYSDSTLQPILSKYGPGVRVTAVYDPHDLGHIRVFEPNNNERYVRVNAVNFEYANGLTSNQNEVIQKKLRDDGKDSSDSDAIMEERIALQEFIEGCMQNRKHSVRRKAARIKSPVMGGQHGNSAEKKARSVPRRGRSKKYDRPSSRSEGSQMNTFKFVRNVK
ncbi:Mu transposase C-terminal domain-containing protein [Advenella kashmirensis]